MRRNPRLLDEVLEDNESSRHQDESLSPHYHSSYSSVVITTRPDGVPLELHSVKPEIQAATNFSVFTCIQHMRAADIRTSLSPLTITHLTQVLSSQLDLMGYH